MPPVTVLTDTFPCGHQRTDENSYRRGGGNRRCKVCTRANQRDYNDRKRRGAPLKSNYQASKTYCIHGHAFTEANTYVVPSTGHRSCRACRSEFMSGGYLYQWKLKRKYHMTSAQRSEMLIAQDGLCAICLGEPATQVDHDHETGRVRGLLCGHCNKALGLMRDDPIALRFAADYLEGKW